MEKISNIHLVGVSVRENDNKHRQGWHNWVIDENLENDGDFGNYMDIGNYKDVGKGLVYAKAHARSWAFGGKIFGWQRVHSRNAYTPLVAKGRKKDKT